MTSKVTIEAAGHTVEVLRFVPGSVVYNVTDRIKAGNRKVFHIHDQYTLVIKEIPTKEKKGNE